MNGKLPGDPSTPALAGPPPVSRPPERPAPEPPGVLDDYHRIADTIGGPNLRLKDNVVQTLVCVAGAAAGAVAGGLWAGSPGGSWNWKVGAGVGGGLGFIVAGVLSGLVLMVIGWKRSLGSRGKRPRS